MASCSTQQRRGCPGFGGRGRTGFFEAMNDDLATQFGIGLPDLVEHFVASFASGLEPKNGTKDVERRTSDEKYEVKIRMASYGSSDIG